MAYFSRLSAFDALAHRSRHAKFRPNSVHDLLRDLLGSKLLNLHPRWRLFDWPQAKLHPRIDKRVALAFLIFNVAPFVYFWLAITLTSYVRDPVGTAWYRYFVPVAAGMLPAFAALGIYRFFLSIVGKAPQDYYWSEQELEQLRRRDKDFLPVRKTGRKKLGLTQPGWETNRTVAIAYVVVPLGLVLLILA